MVAPLVIDARTGRPSELAGAVMNAVSLAAIHHRSKHGQRGDAAELSRLFGANNVAPIGALDEWRADSDRRFVRKLLKENLGVTEQRIDALTGAAGGFPRDFEFIYQEILDEPRRPLNMNRLWQMDTRVPLGARTHTVRRNLHTGDAAITRGTTDIPVVRTMRVEEQFNVAYIVAAVEVNWFEMISNDFQGRNDFADDTRTAIRVIEEKMNRVAFNGDSSVGLKGYIDYPSLATTVSALTWAVGGSSAAAIVGDLNTLANFPVEASGGTFNPTRMATSIRLRNFLFQTQFSSASDISIGEFFLRGQENINSIDGVQEFEAQGPNGEDVITVYDDNLQATANVVIQPPTALPSVVIDAFRNQVVYVAAVGGMVQRDLGNNALRFANVP